MPIPAVVGLVTLGVADVPASARFYSALGFPLSSASVEGEVSFFRTAGGLLGLYGDDDLRRDVTADYALPRGAFRGVTLAINVAGPAEVDAAVTAAEMAGATIIKPPRSTEWGGYHGYVADPDGHVWEIAHNPHWAIDADGVAQLPE